MTDKSEPQKPTLTRGVKAEPTETDARIIELNEEIVKLREQLFSVKDELHGLKNSRVLGRIIKARNKIGSYIHGSGGVRKLPARIVNKMICMTRNVVAPVVPAPARQATKRIYRKTRTEISLRAQSFAQEVSINEINNKKIVAGTPLVSVIIPYYNRADTIDETIDSLQKQTFTNFEVIIVNDGSPEKKSVEKLEHLNITGLRVSIITQQNQGVAMARNNGITESIGKYVICLDSDDIIVPTYIEKSVYVLETQPDIALVTSHMDVFGVLNEVHCNAPYDPRQLLSNNMVITAAAFRREAWEATDGYKSGIGYEDWEFWLSLGEEGYWGKLIPEELFVYRTSLQSRYIEDKDIHWNNIKHIKSLHPEYKKRIKGLLSTRAGKKTLVSPESAFINAENSGDYKSLSGKPNIMVTMPWMTFGGAETLVFNYCREIKDLFNITFVTGLKSENEWEYKFKSLSQNIYHLPNLFEDQRLYVEFISNYITTRKIDVLHIVHNGFMFEMLPELKKRHKNLRVILTLFNDRVPEYVAGAVKYAEYIDGYTTDNTTVAKSIGNEINDGREVLVIPNGIDAYEEFSLALFDREEQRNDLEIKDDELAVFFVGRLSEEKNPNIFVDAAVATTSKNKNVKFFVIGDGPMRTDIEKQIKDSGLKNITYLGYQSEIAKYLSAADVFVLPSSIEGFPLSILEAMAMNVAVIASDVGAVSEVIDSGVDGYVVTPGSAKEIATKIILLATNREKLKFIKQLSRTKVEQKYSNRILGSNYKKLYEKSLK